MRGQQRLSGLSSRRRMVGAGSWANGAPLWLLLPPLLLPLLQLPVVLVAGAQEEDSRRREWPRLADRLGGEPEPTIWDEFVHLALEYQPLDFGQGFPDFGPPEYLAESLVALSDARNQSQWLYHQYTRSSGHPRLVEALARYYREFRNFGQVREPKRQLLVSVGAYEALFAAIQAFVGPGDQVIVLEPAFDAYASMVRLAEGAPVVVRLRPAAGQVNGSAGGVPAQWDESGQFALDMAELEAKMGNRTRMLVLNSPNNPLGKMYSGGELAAIARLCIKHDIIVLADEVYEQLYSGTGEHLSIGQVPGMWERTITVGSAGKSFSVTGWKLGWALGPQALIGPMQQVHRRSVYTVATPLQEALARALEHEMSQLSAGKAGYWRALRAQLSQQRERMARILVRAGLRPVLPEGGYFMLAQFGQLAARCGFRPVPGEPEDLQFARWLSKSHRLQTIPASAFHSEPASRFGSRFVRFCFLKRPETLDRLELLLGRLGSQCQM